MKKVLITRRLLRSNEDKASKLWETKLNLNDEMYSQQKIIELSKGCDGILSSITILTTSILMVSKLPTYSLKRILIPRHLTIFLLLGIGIYVSLLIFYTFETLFFSGIIYLLLIPISFFHYRSKNKKSFIPPSEDEDEDVL